MPISHESIPITPPTAPHVLDAAARYVCANVADADRTDVLAMLGLAPAEVTT